MKNVLSSITFIFTMLIGSYPIYIYAIGESAMASANCAIKHESCKKNAKKIIALMDHSNPCFDFDKEMEYSHCSYAYCMCRCTGEGKNEYSGEAGTQAGCAVTCKPLMPDKNSPSMQKCIESHKKKQRH